MAIDKVVVFGGTGQVGSELKKLAGSEFIFFDSKQANFQEREKVRQVLLTLKPSVVVNLAGYTNVDLAELERTKCFLVNFLAVEEVISCCEVLKSYLVHFSSDYVFDGERGNYDEHDIVSPLNFYGLTKAWSEKTCLLYENSLVVRTSHIFGGRNSIVFRFAEKIRDRKKLIVLSGQKVNITYAVDLAKFILFAIRERLGGLINFANSGTVTWPSLVDQIEKYFYISTEKELVSEFPRPARRPQNSTLNLEKVSGMFNVRNWEIALDEFLSNNFSG
ncbi:MAG: NAD(P)-dependent oxidoreductase [Deltaproteobacteria bacterium]|nr:NAD(P)-dependent oxidoreductase [Deltaproteobacteria bacterium]